MEEGLLVWVVQLTLQALSVETAPADLDTGQEVDTSCSWTIRHRGSHIATLGTGTKLFGPSPDSSQLRVRGASGGRPAGTWHPLGLTPTACL